MQLHEKSYLIYTIDLPSRISKWMGGNVLAVFFIYIAFNSKPTLFPYIIICASLIGILFFLDFLLPLKIISTEKNLVIQKLFSKTVIAFQDLSTIEVRPLTAAEQLPLKWEDILIPRQYGLFVVSAAKDYDNRIQKRNHPLFKGNKEICDRISTGIRENKNRLFPEPI